MWREKKQPSPGPPMRDSTTGDAIREIIMDSTSGWAQRMGLLTTTKEQYIVQVLTRSKLFNDIKGI